MKVGTEDIWAGEDDLEIEYDEDNDLVMITWRTSGGSCEERHFGPDAKGLDELIKALKAKYQEEYEMAVYDLNSLVRRLGFDFEV